MRLRLGCGERFVADEYCLYYLLSQMPATVEYGAKTFPARPFRAVSEHSGGIPDRRLRERPRSAIFRQTIKRVCYLRRGTVETALKFEMAKWQFNRTAHRISAHPMISHLLPAACGQTNIRPMQVRQKRAVFAWVPAEDEQRTADRIGCGAV